MTKEAVVELDSWRLAQYAFQVPCYVCEGPNQFDAELCRHCCAPMALSQQSRDQKVQPRLVGTIGPPGVGKTVYLGMLIDMLSRQMSGLQMLARGAFSVTLQQSVIAALSSCEFPPKTPSEPDRWNWVHCQVRSPKQRRPVELIMPDVAGDALLEEVDHPNTYLVIRKFLTRCAGMLMLIDTPRVAKGAAEQDFFTMKLLGYLGELDAGGGVEWRKRPMALVFTKADQCEDCFDDPERFARMHTPGLWHHCQERFPTHKFFAAGVVGGTAYRQTRQEGRVRVPLRIEPRGITQPFEWLVQSLR
jgi:hypothetical protein